MVQKNTPLNASEFHNIVSVYEGCAKIIFSSINAIAYVGRSFECKQHDFFYSIIKPSHSQIVMHNCFTACF